MRRATPSSDGSYILTEISIHALREESDFDIYNLFVGLNAISIHALREESDTLNNQLRFVTPSISIHALREESDLEVQAQGIQHTIYFNPRSPWGERH